MSVAEAVLCFRTPVVNTQQHVTDYSAERILTTSGTIEDQVSSDDESAAPTSYNFVGWPPKQHTRIHVSTVSSPTMPPFLCRSALLTLYALLLLLFVSVAVLLVVIHLSRTSNATSTAECQPRSPVVDLTMSLWKMPFDYLAYEILGYRYFEHACCDNDESSKT